jgi:dihydropteroate synthase
MRKLPRILTQWFGAALEAYKQKTRKNHIDAATTLAIHEACEAGFHAMNDADGEKMDAISAALADHPMHDVVLSGYAATAARSRLLGLYRA